VSEKKGREPLTFAQLQTECQEEPKFSIQYIHQKEKKAELSWRFTEQHA